MPSRCTVAALAQITLINTRSSQPFTWPLARPPAHCLCQCPPPPPSAEALASSHFADGHCLLTEAHLAARWTANRIGAHDLVLKRSFAAANTRARQHLSVLVSGRDDANERVSLVRASRSKCQPSRVATINNEKKAFRFRVLARPIIFRSRSRSRSGPLAGQVTLSRVCLRGCARLPARE